MVVELLAIVQAEQAAEALISEAHARKEHLIRQAMAEREAKLREVKAPEIHVPQLQSLNPHLESIKETARRNKAKAVKRILEEIYAA